MNFYLNIKFSGLKHKLPETVYINNFVFNNHMFT